MTDPIIPLTLAEIYYAAIGGVMRRISNLNKDRKREEGRKDLGFDSDCGGYIAEFAFSKAFRRFWSPGVGFLDTDTGDVCGVQVKSISDSDPRLSLIVQADDPPHFKYVLIYLHICSEPFQAEVLGWQLGSFCKDPEKHFWRPKSATIHQAAFFVPQSELLGPDTLTI